MRNVPTLPTPPGWLRSVPLAHRGLHGVGVGENTLEAFRAAAGAGVAVELDVHRSRDGVPVVVHDPVVVLDQRPRAVSDLTADELARVQVPRLAEALAVLTDVPVMVEVKSVAPRPGPLEPAVASVLDSHPGPLCVASFNPRTLMWFRQQRPELPRAQTAGRLAEVPMPALLRWSLRTLRWLRAVQPAAVSYALADLDESAVQAYRAAGGLVVAWTVTTTDALARARRLADNVVFERLAPSVVRAP